MPSTVLAMLREICSGATSLLELIDKLLQVITRHRRSLWLPLYGEWMGCCMQPSRSLTAPSILPAVPSSRLPQFSSLSMSAMTGASHRRKLAPLSVPALAAAVSEAFAARAAAAGVDLVVAVDPQLLLLEDHLLGDAQSLRQCLHYLAENVRALLKKSQ